MNSIEIKANAKINLTLEIQGKRPDGYHNIKSIMHKIGLCDIVTIKLNENVDKDNAGKITVTCSKDVCPEKDNLAYKAAHAFADLYYKKTNNIFSANIHIEKIIPEKAGLGGGSADCAAVLDGLYELLGVLNKNDIYNIACTLGSDVPFMLKRYDCALATGTGTNLLELPMMPCCFCVIGTPKVGLSTPEIYRLFDEKKNTVQKVKTNAMISALEQEDFVRICDNVSNQFEPICIHELLEIGKIKKKLLKCGAYASQMTGSGSAVFGIFDSESSANNAADVLRELPFEIDIKICKI